MLKELDRVSLRFQEIFDTARDRTTAARWLRQWRREAERLGLDLKAFFATYDRWKTEILNDFDARQTSAAVEGIIVSPFQNFLQLPKETGFGTPW